MSKWSMAHRAARDAGPGELLGHLLALVAFAVVLVWASVRRVSKMTA